MDTIESKTWRVRTAEGTEYGPVGFEQLLCWVREGRVPPDGLVSSGNAPWAPVHHCVALEMVFLVEYAPGHYYGPVHHDVIERMRTNGQLPPSARLFRLTEGKEGEDARVRQIQALSSSNERLAEALLKTAQNEVALRASVDDIQNELEALRLKTNKLRDELARAKAEAEEARKQKPEKKKSIFSGKSSAELAQLEEAAKRELWMMKLRKAGSEKALHYGTRGAIDVDARTVH